jgi:hypothetical protein
MGLLANRGLSDMINAILQWNTTITSLDQAGFPYNQVLDYLPDSDTRFPWVYKPEEWNNSWMMDCKYTYLTPITLYDTGNCSTFYNEMPGLDDIIPANKYDNGSNVWYWPASYWEGENPSMIKDTLISVIGWKFSDYDNTTDIPYGMTITLASIHLHEHPGQMNGSSSCAFGTGNVTSASYTRIECDLRRLVHKNVFNIAYPDTDYIIYVAGGLNDFHRARLPQESISNSGITVPTPQDLVRFFQAYLITKDTLFREPVSRILSVRVQIVQLSVVFLVITVLLAILVLFGILTYGFSMLRYSKTLGEMPQSTLDWILKVIQAQHPQLGDPQSGDRIPSNKAFWRHSITSRMTDIYASSKRTWKRAEFENARYGAVQFQEQDLGEGRLLQQRHGRAEYCSDAATVWYVQGPVPQVIPRKPVGSIVPYVQGPAPQVIPRKPVGSVDATELMMDFPENQNSFS